MRQKSGSTVEVVECGSGVATQLKEPLRDPLLPGRVIGANGRPVPKRYTGQQSMIIHMGVHAHGSDEYGR